MAGNNQKQKFWEAHDQNRTFCVLILLRTRHTTVRTWLSNDRFSANYILGWNRCLTIVEIHIKSIASYLNPKGVIVILTIRLVFQVL